jgi:hypothetical protein
MRSQPIRSPPPSLRRTLAPLAAAWLALQAGCTVTTTGAPCDGDGNCPSGQRCVGAVAGTQGSGKCEACDLQCASGLVCGTSAGQEACVCPPGGATYWADGVAGTAPGGSPSPTGAQQPPACRFRTLTAALAAASGAGGTAEIRATGGSLANVMVFSEGGGETYPLDVPGGVTLATDTGGAPGAYVIEVGAPVPASGGASPVVRLEAGAQFSGYVVRPTSSGAASDGVLVACTQAGIARVADVAVQGKPSGGSVAVIDDGIHLAGPCNVEVARGAVSGVGRTGLRIESSGTAAVTVGGARIQGCGDSGLVLNVVDQPTVSLVDSVLSENSGLTPRGPAGRRAGGAFFFGVRPAALTFQRNQVYGNKGDQVMLFSSFDGWNLAGGSACTGPGSGPNVIACYDPATNGTGAGSGPGVGVIQISSGKVDARFNAWQDYPPAAGTDYLPTTAGVVDAVGAGNDVCPAATVACP